MDITTFFAIYEQEASFAFTVLLLPLRLPLFLPNFWSFTTLHISRPRFLSISHLSETPTLFRTHRLQYPCYVLLHSLQMPTPRTSQRQTCAKLSPMIYCFPHLPYYPLSFCFSSLVFPHLHILINSVLRLSDRHIECFHNSHLQSQLSVNMKQTAGHDIMNT